MLEVHSEASHHAKGYLLKARLFFEKNSKGMELENHYHHNVEPNFWKHMVNPVLENPIASSNQLALEFGCGAGRNLLNLLIAAPFLRVDGIDISKSIASSAQVFVEKKVGPGRTVCLQGNGWSCLPFPSDSYTYVISHQVFIHIPHRTVRLSILTDMHRILKVGGVCVIHFKTMTHAVPYSENFNGFPKNVTVVDADKALIVEDFESAGFAAVEIATELNYVDGHNEYFITATK